MTARTFTGQQNGPTERFHDVRNIAAVHEGIPDRFADSKRIERQTSQNCRGGFRFITHCWGKNTKSPKTSTRTQRQVGARRFLWEVGGNRWCLCF